VTTVGKAQTFRGGVDASDLGATLIHEHIFAGHPELDLNFPHPEWDEAATVDRAVDGLERLWDLGIRTVVDLTVLGLGRDVRRVAEVAEVAERTRVNLVASTGYYTTDVLPPFFQTHGPGRLVDGPDPLVEFFVRDIEDHPHAPSQSGREQLAYFRKLGVDPERLIIGHCGDSEDLDYLSELMDAGCTIGMDRFGMEHVLVDDRRIATVDHLLRLGYAERMVLSHDAAVFSRTTPPSWRAEHAPHWPMENISRRIIPRLLETGASEEDLHQMLVGNPARLIAPHPMRKTAP
jgi:phosphotriesterase-related protein